MAQTRNWTSAQRQAIEDRGGTLLVSAAAGSGKTAVLVERAVRLICDEHHPVDADRLLIVTFTRAAAEELRGRIAERLAQEAALDPGSVWLRRQRLLLGRADICTIDAFCMQLLKTYFAQLDLPPDFGLADDATAYALRGDALAQTLEEMYQDEDFRRFADCYGRARSDAAAADAVLGLYDFLRTLPHPQQALEQLCADYADQSPLEQTKWGAFLLEHASDAVKSAKALLASAEKIVAGEPALANYGAALESDRAFFDALSSWLQKGRWDSALLCAQEYVPPAFKAVRGYNGADMDAVKALREEVKKVHKELKEKIFLCTQAEFEEDRQRILPMLNALARAVRDFEQRFFAAKIEQKVLEYSDFEHLSLRLLCGENDEKTEVARAVSGRFDAVMVDEYQDTNALQALLYRCLANDDASNLFFVGDVKQSIYRFRLASPEIFIAQREAFAPYQEGGPHPATITLGNNFRSAGSVIDGVNDVFSCVMKRQVGDVDYNAEEMLYRGVPDSYDGGPVEVYIADQGTKMSDLGDAPAVADLVQKLVREGFAVRDKNGGTRPCQYGDICILLRSRAGFSLYEQTLTGRGVPVAADAGDSPLTAGECAPVLSMLRVIDNPAQDVHMAAVLLSPMFDFTPDDLVRLRAEYPKLGLYAALTQSKEEKAVRFCRLLRRLRALAATAPVAQLCDEILAQTHYFAAVGAMENGAERRETLRAFTAWASAVGAGGLPAVIRMADNAIDSGALPAAGAVALPKGCVSIMTIHRSKGLEFPVVILADGSHQFNLRDVSNRVLFHPQLGLGMTLRAGEGGLYDTAPHKAIAMALREESVSEEMRILYVALTRARDKLILTLPLAKPEKVLSELATQLAGAGGASPYLLRKASSFAPWICTAALLHPDCGNLRALAGGATLSLYPAQGHIRATVVSLPDQQQEQQQAEFARACQPDPALTAPLRRNFAAQYPRAALSDLPAKLSVSGLAHGGDQPVLARPAFLYQEGMTAAEKGTALHSVLQFADLQAAREDLQSEVARLVDEKYIDAHIAAQLDEKRIQDFFDTDLSRRMLTAEKLLREYAFLTAVPAKYVQPDIASAFQNQPVLVQGIADAVLINGDEAEIVDYKTDQHKTPRQFLESYARQLLLYKAAVEKRLPVKVTACTIYSFQLGQEISVPLEKDEKNP